MRLIFLFLVGFLFLSLTEKPNEYSPTEHTKGPFFIKYVQPVPPDSICDFITSYFKIKKVEIITKNTDLRSIFQEKGAQVESAMRSYNEDPGGLSFSDKVMPILESPMSFMLFIRAFSDTLNSSAYVVDSIQWSIKPVPFKDSAIVYKTFKITKKDNAFISFKEFVDFLVKSEL